MGKHSRCASFCVCLLYFGDGTGEQLVRPHTGEGALILLEEDRCPQEMDVMRSPCRGRTETMSKPTGLCWVYPHLFSPAYEPPFSPFPFLVSLEVLWSGWCSFSKTRVGQLSDSRLGPLSLGGLLGKVEGLLNYFGI